MNEYTLEALYNFYYTQAIREASDIDASLWAYETACQDMRDMNRAELNQYMKQRGIK